jgi:hypothetical protein
MCEGCINVIMVKKRYKIYLNKFMNDKSNNFHAPKV